MSRMGSVAVRQCDGDLAQEDKALDVVDEIGHSDLGRCSGDPDSPDEQPHPILLLGEHMLDTRADFRFRLVGLPHRLGHSARPFGFLRWMWLTKPFLVRNVSLAADR